MGYPFSAGTVAIRFNGRDLREKINTATAMIARIMNGQTPIALEDGTDRGGGVGGGTTISAMTGSAEKVVIKAQ